MTDRMAAYVYFRVVAIVGQRRRWYSSVVLLDVILP